MKKALIEGTRICEVRKDTFPVSEPLFWVDVPDTTTTLDTWVGGRVVKFQQDVLVPIKKIETEKKVEALWAKIVNNDDSKISELTAEKI